MFFRWYSVELQMTCKGGKQNPKANSLLEALHTARKCFGSCIAVS